MSQLLEGLRVLVTRPAAQATRLCKRLEQAGAECRVLPVMEILGYESTESQSRLRHSGAWDMIIFVSRNAVACALPCLVTDSLPTVVAIGRKTADYLEQHGISADIVPPTYNSEGLLAMPVMQRVAGKRILIVRGHGGREKMAATLSERGASVEYAEVYRRKKPTENAARLQAMLAHQQIDVVTVASGDALQNLLELAGEQKNELLALPLFVLSERIGKLAQQAGFADTGIHVADEASDEGLFEAMTRWHQQEEASE